MPRLHRLALVSAIAGLLLAGTPAWPDSEQDRAREAVESGQVRPLKAILKSVRRQYDGQILDAELFDRGGVWLYRIRVLTKDGRVIDLGVDGQTGQIIDVQGGE
ncbi:MAG: PepSY domain-containing protein [Alphaproteobacteria bacterium]